MGSPSTRACTGHVAVDDGLRIWWEDHGAGEHALVVPSASWMARDLDPLLGGRRVVFYDVRGRGRSSTIRDEALLGVERDVADLEHLRRELGIERMALLGWSYHGGIAARYALARPERVERIVLVGPTAPTRDPWFDDFLANFAQRVPLDGLERLERLRREGLKQRDPHAWCRAVHHLYLQAYVARPEHLERMRSSPCVEPNVDPDHVNNQGRRAIEVLGRYDWRPELAALAAPVLILHGREDPVPVGGSREWLRALADARWIVWEDVGHMPWLDRPDLFFPPVERFLGGDWPPEALAD